MLQLRTTPIETYRVDGRVVRVKREDLCALPPAPPLGKLRGLQPVVSALLSQGHRTIGCWDTRVSKLGIGLAAVVAPVKGARAIFFYPQLKGEPIPDNARQALALGAELLPMRGNHVGICVAQARALMAKLKGVLLPFGLECQDAVDAVAREASTIPAPVTRGGTVVLSCGSGVTLAGVVRGLTGRPSRVLALSSGRSLSKLKRCVGRYLGEVPPMIDLIAARDPYSTASDAPCPFPSHPNYDRKAWHLLRRRIRRLQPPILFWNIGA